MPDELTEEQQSDAELLESDATASEASEATSDATASEEETEETEEEEEEGKEKKEAKEDEDKPFPYERPSIQEIKKEFPEFFKKFPIFRDVVFREIEFTKVFPTIEDAKESLEDSLALTGLRNSVLAGKSEDIFDAIVETDKKAAERFALGFLSTLHSKDQALYSQAVSPLFETLCRTLGKSSDENTRNAALVVANYLFGENGDDITNGKKTFTRNLEETEDEKKIKKEREEFESEKLKDFTGGVVQEMQLGLVRMITNGLDPDKSMSEYAKKTLIHDIIDQVDKALASDKGHMSVMNARWLRAKKEGLNLASKEKLVSAYLSRAKQVIPSIRDKARNDFLGVRAKSSAKKAEEIEEKSERKKEVTSGSRSSSGGRTVLKPSRDLYHKMSDLDILND